MIRFNISIAVALFLAFVPRCTKADGGIIRFQETRGPFSITIFSPADAAVGRPVDLSVLIQEKQTRKAILDAKVTFTFNPPPEAPTTNRGDSICGSPQGAMRPPTIHATREQASNKLLYAAPVTFDLPGDWNLHVNVSRATGNAEFDCRLPVAAKSGELGGVWPYLLLPPVVIFAFAANQWLRRQQLQKE